jgi:hypothetical protein
MRSPKSAFDLRAALTEEARAALEEFEASADDTAAIHRCRVRLKRARALGRVGEACAPGLSAVFVDSIRIVMRALDQPRDLAALSEAAQALARRAGDKTASALLAAAHNLDGELASLPELNTEALRARLRDLLALAQVWPEASPRQIRKGAQRVARRAARARQRGRSSTDPAFRHAWRTREKDRYYAALLLGRAWPGRRRRKLGAKIADALGAERDAALLMERLTSEPTLAGEAARASRALKALGRRRQKVAERADALGCRLRGCA